MSVSSVTNRVLYTGDGSSTIFPFPFYFFSPNDLNVYLFDTGSSIVYPQVIGTNYTVGGTVNSQGVYPSGGTVIATSAFPTNLEMVITRGPSQVQNFVLNQNSPINSLGLTQQFDYLTCLVQRIQDQVSRCIQLPDGVGTVNGSSFGVVLPSNINQPGVSANLPLVVNSGATGITTGFLVGSSAFFGILPTTSGGTGLATANTSVLFQALSPMTTAGDLIVGSGGGSAIALHNGAPGQVLTANSGSPASWQAVPVLANVNARFHGAGMTTLGNSDTPIFFLNKDYDTNSAYGSGGVYTVPVAGKYHFAAAFQTTGTFALNNTCTLSIYLNGSLYSQYLGFAGGAESNIIVSLSDMISCSSGHLLQFQASTTATGPGVATSNFRNYMAISLVGT